MTACLSYERLNDFGLVFRQLSERAGFHVIQKPRQVPGTSREDDSKTSLGTTHSYSTTPLKPSSSSVLRNEQMTGNSFGLLSRLGRFEGRAASLAKCYGSAAMTNVAPCFSFINSDFERATSACVVVLAAYWQVQATRFLSRTHTYLPGLNATAFLDMTSTAAPVRGLRPVRAVRYSAVNIPKPRSSTRSPSFIGSTISCRATPTTRSRSR